MTPQRDDVTVPIENGRTCPRCGWPNGKGHADDCPRHCKWARLVEGADTSGKPRLVPLISEAFRIECEPDGLWHGSAEPVDLYRVVIETRDGDFISKTEFALEDAAVEYGMRAVETGRVDRRFWFLV